MAAKTRKQPARKPPAQTVKVRYVGGRPAGAAPDEKRRTVTPGGAAQSAGAAARAVTQREGRYSAKHMLTAELIAGVLIVAIRAIADYEPQADGTLKGKIGHPKGQYGPLPILAGLIVTFFLLSFLAASGGTKAKVAVIAGGIVDLGLLMNSSEQFVKVSGTFGSFGKAQVPPGSWVTSGPESGAAIQGAAPSGLNPSSPLGGGTPPPDKVPTGAIPLPASGNCPTGYFRAVDSKGHLFCQPLATSN